MTSLAQFHAQRAKVRIPKEPSTRRLRRILERRARRTMCARALVGIMPTPQREVLFRVMAPLHKRHSNVMDPFRFREYRHPQARKLERLARSYAADIGWRIEFDADGVMHHLR